MRPAPPEILLDNADAIDRFEVADDLRDWIYDMFIAPEGDLSNLDHVHLGEASIGVLWTNCTNNRRMRSVIGQAEIMPPQAFGTWQRGRVKQQMIEWFGDMPDFVLTFYAPAASTMDDASFCALVEHELYHCAQAQDAYGMPKFTQEGRPVFAIRGHDVEEFVGVVARYGATATGVQEMIEAASRRPSVALADIAGACGTCLRAAA